MYKQITSCDKTQMLKTSIHNLIFVQLYISFVQTIYLLNQMKANIPDMVISWFIYLIQQQTFIQKQIDQLNVT